jgi:CDP-diacylglycerol---serine O-phosphatidyltransferase
VVLFSSYLLYGMIRPWVSHTWRREIESVGLEEDGHPDDDDDDEDESDDSPVPPESDKP